MRIAIVVRRRLAGVREPVRAHIVSCLFLIPAALAVAGCTGSPSGPSTTTYSGPVTGQIIVSTTSGGFTCVSTRALNGTMTMTLEQRADGSVTGTADTTGTRVETGLTVSSLCSALASTSFTPGGPVTGTPASVIFSRSNSSTSTSVNNGVSATVTSTEAFTFSGALSGGVVTGTLTYTHTTDGSNGGPIKGSGTTTIAVTLR